jgi:hypothetical protein
MPVTEISHAVLTAARIGLDKLALWREVSAQLPADTRALLESPPPAGWFDGAHYENAILAVHALRGAATVTQYGRTVTKAGADQMRGATIIQGILHLFGPSPHALVTRLNHFNKKSVRGISYSAERLGDRASAVEICFPERRQVPECVFHAQVGVLQALCELLGKSASAEGPELIADGKGNRARVTLRW